MMNQVPFLFTHTITTIKTLEVLETRKPYDTIPDDFGILVVILR
jgi:hypothetical protein